jgi:eukaryotic-like serine/threonine-protein kinase
MSALAADRNLLFGLLALQNGLIDQVQLVAAFQAWTRERTRPLAEQLIARGDLDVEQRSLLEGLLAQHLKKHGGAVAQSLAVISAERSTRESLAALGDPEIEGTLTRLGSGSSADSDRTASLSAGSTTSDGQRFRVLRPHAQGGLGAVYVALDAELHREVALKQLLDRHADDPASRARFLLEAEITGALEHPGIVPVYGLGTYADGRPYYAMRFIRGDSLKGAIDRFHADQTLQHDPGRRAIELQKLLRRFLDVCNAIDYAHSRGVIHRDVKPSNIIVGKHGETLVVDWGLAKPIGRAEPGVKADERTLIPSSAIGSPETLPGSALGTPAFMSPEQAAGDLDRLGPRSDVYSLGATLYRILTGRPPFKGDDPSALVLCVQRGEIPPPRSLDPTIDRALEAVCQKAMARQPEDRYASCRALADEIERWMADEPVSVWREPRSRRVRRWTRRHRTAVTAAAVALSAGVVGLAAVLVVQTRANGRLKVANIALATANERERQRFDLAVDAIRRYHTDVSEDFLLRQDQFKDLRDRLLRDAVSFYRRLNRLLSDQTDVRSRRTLGRAYEEVGELTEKIGSTAESLATHRKALEIRRALAREDPSDLDTTADVGRSLIAIGILQSRLGRYDEAIASFEQAGSLLGGLAGSGSGPARDAILGDLARCRYWGGYPLHRTGKMQEALAAYEEARAILARLAAAHPDDVEYQRLLAWCHNDTGLVLALEGKMSEALAAFEQSRRVKQNVAEDHPEVAEYRWDLAMSYSNIGIPLREIARSDEALRMHREALVLGEALARAYPAVIPFQINLANHLNEAGDDLRMLGRVAEARASFEKGVAILEGLRRANPTLAEVQSYLIQGLRGLGATLYAGGETGEAVATWRRAIGIGTRVRPSYGETLYYLASCHALLGGVAGKPGSGLSAQDRRTELDLAMETLRRAVAAGYRSASWLQRDPDLDPLRSRPDFKPLLMDLAMPAAPFARTP